MALLSLFIANFHMAVSASAHACMVNPSAMHLFQTSAVDLCIATMLFFVSMVFKNQTI